MTLSMMDGTLTRDYEVNTNEEPCAMKVACTVRKGIEREGLATVPRSQSTLHLLFLFLKKIGIIRIMTVTITRAIFIYRDK
jgi:hypothetical protein